MDSLQRTGGVGQRAGRFGWFLGLLLLFLPLWSSLEAQEAPEAAPDPSDRLRRLEERIERLERLLEEQAVSLADLRDRIDRIERHLHLPEEPPAPSLPPIEEPEPESEEGPPSRIAGVEWLADAERFAANRHRFFTAPIAAGEIRWFLRCVERLREWVKAHPDAWKAFRSRQEVATFPAGAELGAWGAIGCTYEEFLAMFLKISAVRSIAEKGAAAFRRSYEERIAALEAKAGTDPGTEEELRRLREELERFDRNVPANVKRYERDREAAERALRIFRKL